MVNTLRKAACFTDIHWGRKNNSELHNQDCMRFIQWFCDNVRNDTSIDHIIFLGDWFEQRNAINGLTFDVAYEGAKLLQQLGLPVYFLVGNHDLYYRTTRDVYSTHSFDSLGFIIPTEPTVYEELGPKGAMLTPFLFHNEYGNLVEFLSTPVWFGHFEFKGFVLTGETKIMDNGPDPDDFSAPLRIFSGHYHKRQTSKNVSYIGNAFPADFSDANDTARGMMVYDYDNDDVTYTDWAECPRYIRTTLSGIIANPKKYLIKDAIVNCIVDQEITYEQSLKLRDQLTNKYDLRDLNLQENPEVMLALETTDIDVDALAELETTSARVLNMLTQISVDTIDNEKLQDIYRSLDAVTS